MEHRATRLPAQPDGPMAPSPGRDWKLLVVLLALAACLRAWVVDNTEVISRDGLRAQLRQTRPRGVPLLAEATKMVADYLAAERDFGRISADADVI